MKQLDIDGGGIKLANDVAAMVNGPWLIENERHTKLETSVKKCCIMYKGTFRVCFSMLRPILEYC